MLCVCVCLFISDIEQNMSSFILDLVERRWHCCILIFNPFSLCLRNKKKTKELYCGSTFIIKGKAYEAQFYGNEAIRMNFNLPSVRRMHHDGRINHVGSVSGK